MSNAVMKPQRRRLIEGGIVIAVAYLLVRAFWFVSTVAGRPLDSALVEASAKLQLWAAVVVPLGWWIAKRRNLSVAEAFGLGAGAMRGVGFGLAATIPMIAALFLMPLKTFQADLSLGSGIIGPFAEELLFRGFLFGLLWRVVGWSATASILASSLLFGLAHIPNADTALLTLLRGPGPDGYATSGGKVVMVIPGIAMWWDHLSARGLDILLTALPLAVGGAVLAWIACKWNSLWPAIALHACMNLWWDAIRGEHVISGVGPDLMSAAQLLSVAIAIALTLRFSEPAARAPESAPNAVPLANDL